ncbi:TetR/AcrR family transcriptional regulator [Microbacterium shaanxiense]
MRSDARDNREQILAIAREAFAREGLDVPIREIARRAGVGPATVYRHFPTKDALQTEAFEHQLTTCEEILRTGLAQEDPGEGFRYAVTELMSLHSHDRGFAHAFTSGQSVSDAFAERRRRSIGLADELAQRARRSGVIRPDVTLDDLILVLAANAGLRAENSPARVRAARRLADLSLRAFENRGS